MESLHYLLMRSNAIFSRRILSEVNKIGLTAGQPKVLDFLRTHGEADQKTIASYCEIEQATVVSILLRRQREGNRRSLFVSLTDRGREAAGQVAAIFEKTEAPVVSALTGEELNTLRALLEKTCRILSDSTGKENLKND